MRLPNREEWPFLRKKWYWREKETIGVEHGS